MGALHICPKTTPKMTHSCPGAAAGTLTSSPATHLLKVRVSDMNERFKAGIAHNPPTQDTHNPRRLDLASKHNGAIGVIDHGGFRCRFHIGTRRGASTQVESFISPSQDHREPFWYERCQRGAHAAKISTSRRAQFILTS